MSTKLFFSFPLILPERKQAKFLSISYKCYTTCCNMKCYLLCKRLESLGGGQGLAPIWERGVLPCTIPGEGACAGRWTGAATSPWAVCTIWYAIWLLEGGTDCGCVDISTAPPPPPPWWCEGGTPPAEDTTCQTCYGTS